MKHPSVILSGLLLLGGLGLLGRQFVPGPITSQEQAQAKLVQELLPAIALDPAIPLADLGVATSPGAAISKRDALPSVEAFPLYGAPAVPPDREGSLRVEIVSSLEKANSQRAGGRWLVDAAERFNQRGERGNDGRRIEGVVRPIPSGLAAQMLVAGGYRPAGYSPASQPWLELLRLDGVTPTLLQPSLVGNRSVIAVRGGAWKQSGGGTLAFGPVMERTLAGQLRMGTCNPYLCSPGLDFMHTLLWTTAG
ncbi:MAG: hypothetical protein ACK6AD_14015, partial [Cyanobacteriota bacterium]